MIKLNFQKIWSEFPDHVKYKNLEALYTALGGTAKKNIFVPGFGPNGNTCASRLSMAFNNAGSPIDQAIAQTIHARTLGTSTGARIIYTVTDFKKYLQNILGDPTSDTATPFNSDFYGKQGIIAFSVNWGDASGHIALWNGAHFREPTYDDYSSYVNTADSSVKTSLGQFWELK